MHLCNSVQRWSKKVVPRLREFYALPCLADAQQNRSTFWPISGHTYRSTAEICIQRGGCQAAGSQVQKFIKWQLENSQGQLKSWGVGYVIPRPMCLSLRGSVKAVQSPNFLSCRSLYRDRLKSMQILLCRTQAGPGRTGKQEQEQTSRNHAPYF